MSRFNRWFEIAGMMVCVPPKNGGCSFYRAMYDIPPEVKARKAVEKSGYPKTKEEAAEFQGRKIMAFRDPVARFASLWRDKIRDGRGLNGIPRGASPDMMLDYIIENPVENPHWVAQTWWEVPGCEFIDYRELPEILGYTTHYNRTEGQEEMPVARIISHYQTDVEIWRKFL